MVRYRTFQLRQIPPRGICWTTWFSQSATCVRHVVMTHFALPKRNRFNNCDFGTVESKHGAEVHRSCRSRLQARRAPPTWSQVTQSSSARSAQRASGGGPHRSMGQTLQGAFSAVSKPIFASKYAFESSRRDLHNALLCTALKSHFS